MSFQLFEKALFAVQGLFHHFYLNAFLEKKKEKMNTYALLKEIDQETDKDIYFFLYFLGNDLIFNLVIKFLIFSEMQQSHVGPRRSPEEALKSE